MLMLSVVALSSGCASPRTDGYCELARPIWWESRDELQATPDSLVRQVVRHNETWAAVCGKLSVVALSHGCATVSGGSFCELARPIWWESRAEVDATPDGILRQVVRHNETWAALCGG